MEKTSDNQAERGKRWAQQGGLPARSTAALITQDELDAALEEDARRLGGAGTSQDADDVLLPMIYVLDTKSPQVNKRDPNGRYVEGAEPGMLMRTDTRECFEEIVFQPCHFFKVVNEWVPREKGGGFVRMHEEMPADAKPHPSRERWHTTADGVNDLVDTRIHIGNLIYPDGRAVPCSISMKGTQHSVSRMWMVQMNNRITPGGTRTPSWWTLYRVRTVGRSNTQGSWFVMSPEVLGWASPRLRETGEMLWRQMQEGERKVDFATEQPPAGEVDPGAGDSVI